MFRYYSTQRPILPGGFPRSVDVQKIENFDTKKFCEEIGREAWGYIEYREELSKKEMDDYEFALSSMKTYYCVTTAVYDDGRIISAITSVVEAVCKPENSSKSLKRRDVYNDWFDSQEEAREWVEEAKRA